MSLQDSGAIWLLRVGYRIGVPAALALYFAWFLTQRLTGDVGDTKALLREHMSEQQFYLRAICVNTATSPSQLANCLQPGVSRP